MRPSNVLRVGATRQGKSLAAARGVIESAADEAAVVLDPHKQSLAEVVLTHAATGNVLYDRLSDLRASLGFELLSPSSNPDPVQRQLENQRRAEAFVEILLRRRNADGGMAGAPLMEEWCMAAIMLYLFQAAPKPLTLLPFAFLPGTGEFSALVRDCTLPDVRHKFRQLETLRPRALRAEVGSAPSFNHDGTRLVTAGDDGTARVWALAPDGRGVDVLQAEAELLAGRWVDQTNGLVPLTVRQCDDRRKLLEWNNPEQLRMALPTR